MAYKVSAAKSFFINFIWKCVMSNTPSSSGAGTPGHQQLPVQDPEDSISYYQWLLADAINDEVPPGYSVTLGASWKLFTYPDVPTQYAKHYRTMWNDRIGDECAEVYYQIHKGRGKSKTRIGYGYMRWHYTPSATDMIYGNTLARFYYGFTDGKPLSRDSQSGTMLEYCSDGFNDSPNVNNISDTRVVCYDPTLSDEHVKTLRTWKDVRKVLRRIDAVGRISSTHYLRGYRFRIGSPWYDELTD